MRGSWAIDLSKSFGLSQSEGQSQIGDCDLRLSLLEVFILHPFGLIRVPQGKSHRGLKEKCETPCDAYAHEAVVQSSSIACIALRRTREMIWKR